MSLSPQPRDVNDDPERSPLEDELDHSAPDNSIEPEAGSSAVPVKRGRGRPKGSKNKKTLAASSSTPATPAVPRKRGRPPKEKKDDDEEPRPKRPRGRPRKNPKPEDSAANAAAGGEPSTAAPVKRKRGRPPKNPPPTT